MLIQILLVSFVVVIFPCISAVSFVFAVADPSMCPVFVPMGLLGCVISAWSFKTYRRLGRKRIALKELSKPIDPVTMEPYMYENYVANTLIQSGYRSADVTRQSGDYGVDVIAVTHEGAKVAIQCKRYRGVVGVAAVQEIIAGKEYYGCDLAAVYSTGHYTRQALNMARKTHVKLYILDKDGLRTAS